MGVAASQDGEEVGSDGSGSTGEEQPSVAELLVQALLADAQAAEDGVGGPLDGLGEDDEDDPEAAFSEGVAAFHVARCEGRVTDMLVWLMTMQHASSDADRAITAGLAEPAAQGQQGHNATGGPTGGATTSTQRAVVRHELLRDCEVKGAAIVSTEVEKASARGERETVEQLRAYAARANIGGGTKLGNGGSDGAGGGGRGSKGKKGSKGGKKERQGNSTNGTKSGSQSNGDHDSGSAYRPNRSVKETLEALDEACKAATAAAAAETAAGEKARSKQRPVLPDVTAARETFHYCTLEGVGPEALDILGKWLRQSLMKCMDGTVSHQLAALMTFSSCLIMIMLMLMPHHARECTLSPETRLCHHVTALPTLHSPILILASFIIALLSSCIHTKPAASYTDLGTGHQG